MIAAQVALDALAEGLRIRAETLARSHAAAQILRRRRDPSLWRKAALLWPLFAKG